MDFTLSEEQQMLQDTVARLVRGEYSFEKRLEFSETELGFSEAFWKQLGELGLTAVPFSEELGGFVPLGVLFGFVFMFFVLNVVILLLIFFRLFDVQIIGKLWQPMFLPVE